jgi:predicted nucleotidyltransferase
MGTKKNNLSDALFPKVRQLVLGLLYGQPDRDFYTNEIIKLTQMGNGVIQRELKKLSESGLLIIKEIGNQKRYQANKATPFFYELRGIVLKSFGLSEILQAALKPLFKKISIAFIYGSIAKQTDTANSDIDLLLIGFDLIYGDIFKLLEKIESKVGRKINPTIYNPEEWSRKLKAKNNFIQKISSQPKIFLKGSENELKQLE